MTPTVTPSTSGRPTPRPTPTHTRVVAPPIPLHAPLRLQARGHLSGEGRFEAAVTQNGQPVLQVAHLRPDNYHGSDEAGVVWIDHSAARYELHPGYTDPAALSQWSQPDYIPASRRANLIATFNGGFKTPELRGGYYENGHTAGELRPGYASLVIYSDGHVALGSWDTEVRLTPAVVAVRQNLSMLIDHGRITPGLDNNIETNWGPILGPPPYAWRSGVGVTAAGDLVLVMGDSLTPQTLANLLADAGAVRAMEMDINPAWMSFMWYTRTSDPTQPLPHKLIDFQRPADRYFTDTSRDFFAVYLRSSAR